MVLKTKHIPYVSRSNDGILRYIGKSTKSSNIDSDGFVRLSSSSTASFTEITNPIGAEIKTTKKYWTSEMNDTYRWYKIDFCMFRIALEGYIIHNPVVDIMPHYEIQGSNNDKNYTTIDTIDFKEVPKEANATKNFPITSQFFRYINIYVEGQRFGGENNRFVMYGLDFFGIIKIPNILCLTIRRRYNKGIFLTSLVILIFS